MIELEQQIQSLLDEVKQNLIMAPVQGWEKTRLLEFVAYWEGKRDAYSECLAKIAETREAG